MAATRKLFSPRADEPYIGNNEKEEEATPEMKISHKSSSSMFQVRWLQRNITEEILFLLLFFSFLVKWYKDDILSGSFAGP